MQLTPPISALFIGALFALVFAEQTSQARKTDSPKQPINSALGVISFAASMDIFTSDQRVKSSQRFSKVLRVFKKYPKMTLFSAAVTSAYGVYTLYNWFIKLENHNKSDYHKLENNNSKTDHPFWLLKDYVQQKNFTDALKLIQSNSKQIINTMYDNSKEHALLSEALDKANPCQETIIWLLENGAIFKKSNGNRGLISVAIRKKLRKVIDYCLKKITLRQEQDYQLLHDAAACDDLITVKRLIEEHSFSINTKVEDGATVLYTACKYRSIETIKYLLLKGANLDQKTKSSNSFSVNSGGETALHIACSNMNLSDPRSDIIMLLIKNGAPVNAIDINGVTALHLVSKAGLLDIVRYLVEECKVDINQPDNGIYKRTPVQWALGNRRYDIVIYLIEQGAMLNNSMTLGATTSEALALAGVKDQKKPEEKQKYTDLARLISDMQKVQKDEISLNDFLFTEKNQEFWCVKYKFFVNQLKRHSEELSKQYQEAKNLFNDQKLQKKVCDLNESLEVLRAVMHEIYDHYRSTGQVETLKNLLKQCNLSLKQVRALEKNKVFFDDAQKHQNQNYLFKNTNLAFNYL